MKLTETRIKQIIKEEISKINEQDTSEETTKKVKEIISKMSDEESRLLAQNYINSLEEKVGMK